MKKIQNSILEYARKNSYLTLCLNMAPVMAICYPAYLILSRIVILSIVWRIIGSVVAVLYIAFLTGTVLCFAQNQMLALAVAYGCMTLEQLFSFSYGGTLNRIIYLVFYGGITAACVINMKKTAAQRVMDPPNGSSRFCPQCGCALKADSKFCPVCGTQIRG